MPEYTKEQIDEARSGLIILLTACENAIQKSTHISITKEDLLLKHLNIVLSALSTAEQERESYEKSIDGWRFRAKHAEARVAELEARLQGAADRVDDFDDSCSESREYVSECHAYNNGKCMNAIKCDGKPNYPAKQPLAILGEKEDTP